MVKQCAHVDAYCIFILPNYISTKNLFFCFSFLQCMTNMSKVRRKTLTKYNMHLGWWLCLLFGVQVILFYYINIYINKSIIYDGSLYYILQASTH